MSALGVSALVFLPKLFVAGNPAATAANILSHESAYRWMLFGSRIVEPPYAETIDRAVNVLIQAELPVILWLVIVGARAPGARIAN